MPMKRVLIVEFDVHEAHAMGATLRQHGYDTVVTQSGHEGLRLFLEHYPDLVVINLLMPDMPGPDVIKRIRSQDSQTPIIVISQLAKNNPALIARLGAQGQINKPVDQTHFAAFIEQLIGPAIETSAKLEPRSPAAARRAPRTKPPADERVPDKGSLKQTPFYQIIARAFRQKVSGRLLVKDELGEAVIVFHQGLPVAVRAEGFARRLAAEGKITDEQARELRRRAVNSGAAETDIASQMGLLSPAELLDATRGFCYRVLRDLCRPSPARFQFAEQRTTAGVPLDPAVAIELAAKRCLPAEKIAGALEAKGRLQKPLYLAADPQQLPDLIRRPELLAVIGAARQNRSLNDLLTAGTLPDDRLKAAAYALAMLKIVSFNPDEVWTPPAPEPAPVEPPAPPVVSEPTFPEESVAESEPKRPAPKTPEPPAAEPAKKRRAAKAPEPPPREVKEEPPVEEPEEVGEPLTESQLMQAGLELLQSKTFTKAQRCFEDLLARRGDDPQVLVLYARAAFRNRFTEPTDRLLNSLDALRKAIALQPRLIEARLELARLMVESGEPTLALTEIETALSLDPSNTEAQRELRNLKRRLDRAGT
jgi:CheY-like chemotaxis protein